MKKRFNPKRVALCGLLLSMMLILGWIEKQIPTPHPALKLGLSNSVLIFAVYMLDIPTAYVLMTFKVFLSNVLFGSLGMSFFLGLSGGVASLTAMVLISRVKGMHPITVSIVGSVMHHVGQILMALFITDTAGMLAVLPFLMIGGLIFGAVTGVCADRVMKYLKHMKF
ncbi:MAG: Gx transporter family protein [Clostridia bacterium]|nr:Gx transporter family protein [Clostridia bacterium]